MLSIAFIEFSSYPTYSPAIGLHFGKRMHSNLFLISATGQLSHRLTRLGTLTPQFLQVQLWPQLQELAPPQLQVDPQSQAMLIVCL